MASEEMNNRRRDRRDAENRQRTINYIVIAVLSALVVTVLFLLFGRSDKNSNNGQVQPETTTEKVDNSADYNTVTRPSTSNTVTRPSTNNTVTRPSTGNTVNRPSSEPVSSSSSGSGRVDAPHTTKMDVVNGTYKEGDENKTNNNDNSTNGRRGGTRIR